MFEVRGVRFGVRGIVAAALLAVAGCTTVDRAVGLIPMFTTMRDQVVLRPFESPMRIPPAGSVPVTGREDSLDLYTSDLRTLANPVRATPASVARGGQIYATYCTVCHGSTGGGDGPVAGKLMGIVPALTTEGAIARSDGYLYAIIRHGRGAMPPYGDKIRDHTDRWNVVNYVRTLQVR